MMQKAHQKGYVFGFKNDLLIGQRRSKEPDIAEADDPFELGSYKPNLTDQSSQKGELEEIKEETKRNILKYGNSVLLEVDDTDFIPEDELINQSFQSQHVFKMMT